MANQIMRFLFVLVMIAEVWAVVYLVRTWKDAKKVAEDGN